MQPCTYIPLLHHPAISVCGPHASREGRTLQYARDTTSMLTALTKLTQLTKSMQHAHLAPGCWACASLINGFKPCTTR